MVLFLGNFHNLRPGGGGGGLEGAESPADTKIYIKLENNDLTLSKLKEKLSFWW